MNSSSLESYQPITRMPNYYHVSFKIDPVDEFMSTRLSIKEFTDIKPLYDPHFTFDLQEIKFMLTGQWDMWVDPTIRQGRLIRVRKEVNCNFAKRRKIPELYILLKQFCRPESPETVLLPIIYKMEQQYWARIAALEDDD